MVPVNAPGLPSSVPGPVKEFLFFLAMGLLLIAPSGCSYVPSFEKKEQARDSASGKEPEKTDAADESERALAFPPARGVNTKRLFDESARSDEERFERLESAVQSLRDEIDTLSPSVQRLIAVQQDIQQLSSQLEILVRNEGSAPELTAENLESNQNVIAQVLGAPTTGALTPPPAPVRPAPPPLQHLPPAETQPNGAPLRIAPPPPPLQLAEKSPPPPAAPPPAANAAANVPRLSNIRTADNAGKTRMVLESSGAMHYTADLDNNENILTLIFDKGAADPSLASLPARSKLVKSYTVTPQANGGFVLAIALNRTSKILDNGALPPGPETPHYRVYFDLAN